GDPARLDRTPLVLRLRDRILELDDGVRDRRLGLRIRLRERVEDLVTIEGEELDHEALERDRLSGLDVRGLGLNDDLAAAARAEHRSTESRDEDPLQSFHRRISG